MQQGPLVPLLAFPISHWPRVRLSTQGVCTSLAARGSYRVENGTQMPKLHSAQKY
jgi:hypothetical protein